MYQPVLQNLKNNLQKVTDSLTSEFNQIRAGRANPALIDKITINYHGIPTPIQQVASISVPEARLIVIQPWDTFVVSEIEKAILASDLGITPSNDGKIIRLPFPELTEERRKDLIKTSKTIADNHKISVRNYRKEALDGIKKLEKNESLPEDQAKAAENDIQKIIDDANKNIDELLELKEKDLLEI